MNRDITLPDGRDASGSFRWWGARIAEAVGEGDYLDYYMSASLTKNMLSIMVSEEYVKGLEDGIEQSLLTAGWKIEESYVYCGTCGKKIGRWEPKAFNIQTGETQCVDCSLGDKEVT